MDMSRAVSRPFRRAAAAAVAVALVSPVSAVAAPSAEPSVRPIEFNVQGHADVRTGIQGRVTIAGTFSGRYDTATNRFTGAFALTPTKAHVTVLGLLPVVAETDWIFTEPVTGEWKDGTLRLHAAARIHHPRLLAFGSAVVAGGAKCATRQPSVIDLTSAATAPVTDPFAGGTLSTDAKGFSISALSGCGILDPLLSAVAAGSGNQSTIRLTPRTTR